MDSLSSCIFTIVVHQPAVCLKAWKAIGDSFFLIVALVDHNALIVLRKVSTRERGCIGISIALCGGAGEGAGD